MTKKKRREHILNRLIELAKRDAERHMEMYGNRLDKLSSYSADWFNEEGNNDGGKIACRKHKDHRVFEVCKAIEGNQVLMAFPLRGHGYRIEEKVSADLSEHYGIVLTHASFPAFVKKWADCGLDVWSLTLIEEKLQ